MDPKQAFNQINAGNQQSIEVPYKVSVNGHEYTGIIYFRFPSVRDEILIGLEEAKLRGTLMDVGGKVELVTVSHDSLDQFTQFIVEGLATLSVLSLQKQKFETYPQEVIVDIYRGYLQRKNGSGEADDGPDTSNSEPNDGKATEQGSENNQS